MRIAIDGHDLEGNRTGVGRYLMNILQAWERSGALREHDISIFFKQEIPQDLPEGLSARILPPLLGHTSNALFVHWLLPRAASSAGADVLFCPGYIAPFIWRKPFVVTLHDIIYETHPDLFRYHSRADALLLRRMSRASAERTERILTPSHFTASEVMAHYEVPPERIVVTPLAPDAIFTPERDLDAERIVLKRFGITGPFFFSVGTIQTRRHIPECIEAFAKIADVHGNHQYLIIGSNQTDPHIDIEAIVRQTNEHLGRDAVRHEPYVASDDLAHLYRACEAFVWLSEYEGFGLPPLEAQASGSPVITSRHASLPEAVGECAVFVGDPEDTNEIANTMERIISDHTLAARLRQCGPRHAVNFSWDTTAAATLETLRKAGSRMQ